LLTAIEVDMSISCLFGFCACAYEVNMQEEEFHCLNPHSKSKTHMH
jgi:hypothetical protein